MNSSDDRSKKYSLHNISLLQDFFDDEISGFWRASNSAFRKIPNFCLLSSALHHSNNATATLLASDAVVDVILKESSSKTPLMASRKILSLTSPTRHNAYLD